MRLRINCMVALIGLAAGVLWGQHTPSPALLVLAKSDQALAIVDPVTLKVVAHVPAGPDPHEVVASPDGRLAFISNYGFGAYHTISVVNLPAQKALPRIDLGILLGPHGLAFAGGELYFTAEVNEVLGRYNPLTRRIDWILGTGQMRTHMIEVSRNLDHIYTSNVNSGTISIIEKVTARPGPLPLPRVGGQKALLPAGPGGPGPHPSRVFWRQTVLQTGVGTEGFDISPDGSELWSAASQNGTISIIDIGTKRIVQTLQAHLQGANRVRFTPNGKYVFASSLLGGERGDLAIFDAHTRKQVVRMALGHGAAGILMQPDGSRAYVACSPDNYVAVIDLSTLKVIGRIYPGKGPDGMAWAVQR